MSKNIIIQEGGIGRQFTAAKLQTAEVGGGSVTWIPEDETSLTTKHISANGTYNASDDEAYGYSTVYVNVPGGSGSANADGTPTIENGTEPGGIGSSVIGKDPETGNEIAVGVDEEGNIVQTEVPSAIKVLKAPDKTAYTDGETINYAGIVVHMKKRDGTDFTDTNHPTGLLLLDELILPEKKAEMSDDGMTIDGYTPKEGWPNANTLNPRIINNPQTLVKFTAGDHNTYLPNYGVLTFTFPSDGYVVRTNSSRMGFISTGGFVTFTDTGGFKPRTTVNSITINGTKYCGMIAFDIDWDRMDIFNGIPVSPGWSFSDQYDQLKALLCKIYGNQTFTPGIVTARIPVQWKSTYDGRTFEDSFEITVGAATENDDSGHTGSGGNF